MNGIERHLIQRAHPEELPLAPMTLGLTHTAAYKSPKSINTDSHLRLIARSEMVACDKYPRSGRAEDEQCHSGRTPS